MKYLFIFIIALSYTSCKKSLPDTGLPPVKTDSFTVTVNNGYGTGKYKTGDTINLFSVALADNQLFDKWSSSDAGIVNAFEEWHYLVYNARKRCVVYRKCKNYPAGYIAVRTNKRQG